MVKLSFVPGLTVVEVVVDGLLVEVCLLLKLGCKEKGLSFGFKDVLVG